ncbi:MAG: TlpA family protein disulfide reductase [Acidimicrobiia bacterium]|nr:TlpA family protein disulfide reductase [Acidimicrobiia bacterium]
MVVDASEARTSESRAPGAQAPGEVAASPPRRRTALYSAVGLGVALVLLVTALATSDSSAGRTGESPLLGRPAPALEGPSVLAGGGDFALSDQAGRWTLVNFFATWCVPCQAEHPDLVRFSAAHAEADDARVVSVVFSDDPDDVARYFAEKGGSWPVLEDEVGQGALEWGVTGVPESFLVGPDGTVRAKITGGVEYDKLETLLARAQGGSAGGGG